jgi:hypothetical protein
MITYPKTGSYKDVSKVAINTIREYILEKLS